MIKRRVAAGLLTLIAGLALAAAGAWGQDRGPVLHYDFSAASLTTQGTVRDVSGHGNDATLIGAKLVARGDGYAARFDRPGSYVECAEPGFQSTDALTIAFWFYLEDLPLVWDPFIARADSYSLAMSIKGWLQTNWTGHRGSVETGVLRPMGVWRQVTLVFDGAGEEGPSLKAYENGRLLPHRRMDATGADVDTTFPLERLAPGGALHLGWKPGSSWAARTSPADIPVLEMADFRLYNRVLSAEEVAELFRETVVAQLEVKPYLYRFSDEVILGLNPEALRPLPPGARAEAVLRRPGETEALYRAAGVLSTEPTFTELTVPMADLPPGDYEVEVSAFVGGERLGRASVTPLVWPRRPSWRGAREARVLNALVTELMEAQPGGAIRDTYRFVNPRDGWVFFSTTTRTPERGRLQVVLDPAPARRATPVIIEHDGGAATQEAMRLLPQGEYRLRMAPEDGFRLDRLVVRAVPVLGDGFPMISHYVKEYGAYDWEFMAKDLTPNLNLGYGTAPGTDYGGGGEGFRAWQRAGKLTWGTSRPPQSADAEGVADILAQLQNPNFDGIRIDEIGYPGHHPATAPALRYLAENYPELFAAGQSINLYTYGQGHMFQSTPDRGARELLEALRACNGHYISELYMSSSRHQATARAALDTAVTSWIVAAQRSYPEAPAFVTALFACWNHPSTYNSDMHADVDYKVFMEMQVRSVALDHACFGLRGLGLFQAAHIDEESARWWGRLLRHYAIEGRTDWLWPGSYRLPHLQNPHFEQGLEHWSPTPAEPGSIFLSGAERCGMMIRHWTEASNEARVPGADVVVMRQSPAGPNTLSQPVRELEPGRLYSLRFTTADYQDAVQARAEGREPWVTPARPAGISAHLESGEVLPDKSFSPATPHKPYRDEEGQMHWVEGVAWMETPEGRKMTETGLHFHRIVFRATSETALLTFTNTPAEAGQSRETLLTWVSVRPYLED